jgi:hypothetical protein
MNPDEVQQLQTLIIKIVAARGVPFSLVEQAEVKGWFAYFGLFFAIGLSNTNSRICKPESFIDCTHLFLLFC